MLVVGRKSRRATRLWAMAVLDVHTAEASRGSVAVGESGEGMVVGVGG